MASDSQIVADGAPSARAPADFLRDCWYVAAWSDEVGGDVPLARTLLGIPLVFFRDAAGEPAALLDRCPHRFAPLSRGVLRDGRIACGYHGLAFDGGGVCVHNPHGPVTAALRVRGFPVVDRHRALWIWMGDPARARAETIPDMRYLTDCPESAFSKGYLASYGHYQLYVDNILDLSHTDYLHPTTLGGGGMTRATAKVDRTGDTVRITWESKNDRASPMLDALLPEPGQAADLWSEVCWSPPGVMSLRNGATAAGAPREAGIAGHNAHILTPETTTSSHYFFAATRNFRVDDVALNDRIAQQRATIFTTEDKPMIEAQQQRIGDADFWSLKPALLRTDHAPVIVRRIMDKLIAGQNAADAIGASR